MDKKTKIYLFIGGLVILIIIRLFFLSLEVKQENSAVIVEVQKNEIYPKQFSDSTDTNIILLTDFFNTILPIFVIIIIFTTFFIIILPILRGTILVGGQSNAY